MWSPRSRGSRPASFEGWRSSWPAERPRALHRCRTPSTGDGPVWTSAAVSFSLGVAASRAPASSWSSSPLRASRCSKTPRGRCERLSGPERMRRLSERSWATCAGETPRTPRRWSASSAVRGSGPRRSRPRLGCSDRSGSWWPSGPDGSCSPSSGDLAPRATNTGRARCARPSPRGSRATRPGRRAGGGRPSSRRRARARGDRCVRRGRPRPRARSRGP